MHNTLLRTERLRHGWTQQQLADFSAISLSTVERAEKGEAIRVDCIQRLCSCLAKTPEDLGLLKRDQRASQKKNAMKQQPTFLKSEERDGCFSFGKLKTSWLVLDGNGTESYLPENIRTYYDAYPDTLLEEIKQAKEQVQQEQEQNEKNGKPIQWNGEKYNLTKFVISREPVHEHMKLLLWFKPTDYYTLLAKNRCLEDPRFREKYLFEQEWEMPTPSLPGSNGVGLCLLTSDGYTIFTQRGTNVGVRPGVYETSVVEGLNRPQDRSTTSQAPDVYRAACRGLSEELGLQEHIDFSVSDILLLSFGVDTQYIMRGLRGIIKTHKTADEVIRNWEAGVKDKMENKKLFAIPFTPQNICSFVFSHEPFAPGGLICLYHALIHEFGKREVDTAISS